MKGFKKNALSGLEYLQKLSTRLYKNSTLKAIASMSTNQELNMNISILSKHSKAQVDVIMYTHNNITYDGIVVNKHFYYMLETLKIDFKLNTSNKLTLNDTVYVAELKLVMYDNMLIADFRNILIL